MNIISNCRRLWENRPKHVASILVRYIGFRVMRVSTFVLAVLVGLELLSASFKQMGRVATKPMVDIGHGMLIDLWLDIIEYLPYAFLLGALWVFSDLTRHREMLATRSTGLSPMQLLWMALRLPILSVFLLLGAQQYVPAWMYDWAKSSGYSGVSRQANLWYKEDGDYWRMSGVNVDGTHIKKIKHYRYDDKKKLNKISYYAQGLHYDHVRASWNAHSVHHRLISGKGNRAHKVLASARAEDTVEVALPVSPSALRILITPEDYLSLSDRWKLAHHLEVGTNVALRHEFVFWRMLVMPLLTAVFVLVAFVMTTYSPPRSDTLAPVFIGAFLGILFAFFSNLMFSAGLAFQWNALSSTLLPVLLVVIGGLVVLNKQRLVQMLVYNAKEE